jgi:hypothetical protein
MATVVAKRSAAAIAGFRRQGRHAEGIDRATSSGAGDGIDVLVDERRRPKLAADRRAARPQDRRRARTQARQQQPFVNLL